MERWHDSGQLHTNPASSMHGGHTSQIGLKNDQTIMYSHVLKVINRARATRKLTPIY